MKAAREIASVINNAATLCLRRRENGAPSSTAQNTTAPPLFHGLGGALFPALAVAVIVSVE